MANCSMIHEQTGDGVAIGCEMLERKGAYDLLLKHYRTEHSDYATARSALTYMLRMAKQERWDKIYPGIKEALLIVAAEVSCGAPHEAYESLSDRVLQGWPQTAVEPQVNTSGLLSRIKNWIRDV